MADFNDDHTHTANSVGVPAVWTDDGHTDDDTVTAWLDGELAATDRALVCAHVNSCTACTANELDARVLKISVSRLLRTLDTAPQASPVSAGSIRRLARPAPVAPIVSRPTHPASVTSVVARANRASSSMALSPSTTAPSGWRSRSVARAVVGLALVVGGAAFAMAKRNGFATAPATTLPTDTPRLVRVPLPGQVSGNLERRGDAATTIAPPKRSAVQTRHVIVGTVSSGGARGRGMPGVVVGIPNTELATVTDSLGRFVLYDVPRNATSVQAKHALGFTDGNAAFSFAKSDTANVAITLYAAVLQLNAVVVGPGASIDVLPAIECLVAVKSAKDSAAPVFRMLFGRMDVPAAYRLDIVDWPTKGHATSAAFILGKDGLLSGSAKDAGAQVSIVVTRKGEQFVGTVRERRTKHTATENSNLSRTEDLVLKIETSADRCNR